MAVALLFLDNTVLCNFAAVHRLDLLERVELIRRAVFGGSRERPLQHLRPQDLLG